MDLKIFKIMADGESYSVAARTEQEARDTFFKMQEEGDYEPSEIKLLEEVPRDIWHKRYIVFTDVPADEATEEPLKISYSAYIQDVTEPEVFASTAWF